MLRQATFTLCAILLFCSTISAQTDEVVNTVKGSSNSLESYVRSSTTVQLMHVPGFSAIDDGGGGDFQWIAGAPPASTDPGYGAIVIVPNNTGGNNSGGYWQRVMTEDFINVRWFGANPSQSNNHTFFNKAILYATTNINEQKKKIYVPSGTYNFSTGLVINKSIELFGDGGVMASYPPKTQLYFYGLSGAAIHLVGIAAGYSKLHDFMLKSDYGINHSLPPHTASIKHGIEINHIAEIRNVSVSNFEGDAFHLYGIEPNTDPSRSHEYDTATVSFSHLEDCYAIENGNNGFYTEGPNANSCSFIHCDSRDNMNYGFYDHSFLGNNYVTCMTHANGSSQWGGSFLADQATSACVFTGCYVELGQRAPSVTGRSVYLGGANDLGVAGPYIAGKQGFLELSPGWQSPYVSANDTTAVNMFAYPNVGLGLEVQNTSYALKYDEHNQGIAFKVANLDDANVWETPSTKSGPGSYGRSVVPGRSMIIPRLYLYSIYNGPGGIYYNGGAKRLGMAQDIPSAGDYEHGDVLLNSGIGKENALGWRYMKTSPSATGYWKELQLYNELTAKVTTTNTTPTQITTFSMQNNEIVNGVATFFGKEAGGNVITGKLHFKAKKISNVITILQSVSGDNFSEIVGASWALTDNGTDLVLNVTGSSQTMDWTVKTVLQTNL